MAKKQFYLVKRRDKLTEGILIAEDGESGIRIWTAYAYQRIMATGKYQGTTRIDIDQVFAADPSPARKNLSDEVTVLTNSLP